MIDERSLVEAGHLPRGGEGDSSDRGDAIDWSQGDGRVCVHGVGRGPGFGEEVGQGHGETRRVRGRYQLFGV